MSWQNELVRITRFLIDDISEPYTYDDSRLEETILVCAQLMKHELTFDNDYTIDVDTLTLSPDPTEGTKDNGFINLACMKTACIILRAEVKTESLKNVVVKDGPSSIDMGGRYDATKTRADEICKDYEEAKLQYQLGNSRAGQAIVNTWVVDRLEPYYGNL